MVRRRGGRRRAIGLRSPMPLPLGPNQRWSLDFVHDQMTDGRRLRILSTTTPANAWRWCRHIDFGHSGRPRTRQNRRRVRRPGGIVSDNGTELTSTAILAWSDRQNVA
jgi:putative transposase